MYSSKNIAYLLFRSKIFETLGLKDEIFKYAKNLRISFEDSGKTVGISQEMKPKITSGGRSLKKML